MQNEEVITETEVDLQSQMPRISKLAITSVVFGISGPFSSGVTWIASVNNFVIGSHFVMVIFSCGVASILGLLLGVRSLEQIRNSEDKLIGREYAIVGTVTSAVWLFLVFVGLFLPTIHSINS